MDENAPPPSPPPLPPVTPPPVIIPLAPAPPPRRGRGWMIFAIILLVLLAISLFGNFSSMVSNVVYSKGRHIRAVGPKLEEVITEDNEATEKIAVIEVNGIITSHSFEQGGYGMVELIKAQLKRAEE